MFLSILMLILLSACSQPFEGNLPTPAQESPFEVIPGPFEPQAEMTLIPHPKQSACPHLESQLYQLTQSANPISDAQGRGLRVVDGKVQVLFVLAGADSAFLLEYDVELGSQSENLVQGFAPVDRLCELVNLPQVLTVRPPAAAIFP